MSNKKIKRLKTKLPFLDKKILKKIRKKKKKILSTRSRSSSIIPAMVGHTIAIYNGKIYIPIYIKKKFINHKLGEFVPTRIFNKHLKKDKISQHKKTQKKKKIRYA
nr:ribosomal protein S19 [Thismia panamensis]